MAVQPRRRFSGAQALGYPLIAALLAGLLTALALAWAESQRASSAARDRLRAEAGALAAVLTAEGPAVFSGQDAWATYLAQADSDLTLWLFDEQGRLLQALGPAATQLQTSSSIASLEIGASPRLGPSEEAHVLEADPSDLLAVTVPVTWSEAGGPREGYLVVAVPRPSAADRFLEAGAGVAVALLVLAASLFQLRHLARSWLGPLQGLARAEEGGAGQGSGGGVPLGRSLPPEVEEVISSQRLLRQRLAMIRRLGEALVEAEAPDVERRLLQAVAEGLAAARGSLWLQEAYGTYRVVALFGHGEGRPAWAEQQARMESEPLLQHMRRERAPILLPEARAPAYRALLGEGLLAACGYENLLAVPLFGSEQLAGFFLLDRGLGARGFSLSDVDAARLAGNLIAGALRERGPGTAGRLRDLADLAAMLTARHHLPEVLQGVVERGMALAGSVTCSVLLVDPEAGVVRLVAQVGLGAGRPDLTVSLEDPLVADFLSRGQPLLVEDIDRDLPALRDLLIRSDVQAIQVYPLQGNGRTIGALTLGYTEPRAIGPSERALGEALASVAAAAIQNARAFEREADQRDRLATVAEIGRRLSSILQAEQILGEVCELLAAELGYDFVHVFLVEEGGRLRYAAGSGEVGERLAASGLTLPLDGSSFVGRVVQAGQLLVEHPAVPDRLHQAHPSLGQVASEAGVPIIAHGQTTGVLNVQSRRAAALDAWDEQLLRIVADQVAVALDNAWHHEELQRQARLDSLTQVLNHGAFLESLHALVETCRRDGTPLSLIMLDVDTFKAYNDRFGHVAGDAALRTTVQAIRSHVKQRDVIGRWGGEEFGIVLVGATKTQARRVADRVRATLAALRPVDDLGREMPSPTVSQGIATLGEDAVDANTLVDVADRALYRAKEAGRDQVRLAGED